jgi:hypothetical protein
MSPMDINARSAAPSGYQTRNLKTIGKLYIWILSPSDVLFGVPLRGPAGEARRSQQGY